MPLAAAPAHLGIGSGGIDANDVSTARCSAVLLMAAAQRRSRSPRSSSSTTRRAPGCRSARCGCRGRIGQRRLDGAAPRRARRPASPRFAATFSCASFAPSQPRQELSLSLIFSENRVPLSGSCSARMPRRRAKHKRRLAYPIMPSRPRPSAGCRAPSRRPQFAQALGQRRFRQLAAIGVENQTVVVIDRRRQAEQRLQQAVDAGRPEQILPAHDIGDALTRVVDRRPRGDSWSGCPCAPARRRPTSAARPSPCRSAPSARNRSRSRSARRPAPPPPSCEPQRIRLAGVDAALALARRQRAGAPG